MKTTTAAARDSLATLHSTSQLSCLATGMRPESMAYVAEHIDELPAPMVVVCADGSRALSDGRHRVAVSRELGRRWVDCHIYTMSRSGNLHYACERRLTIGQ